MERLLRWYFDDEALEAEILGLLGEALPDRLVNYQHYYKWAEGAKERFKDEHKG